MKEKVITATHRQILYSAFPGHEIEVVFTVDAVIRHDDDGNEMEIYFEPLMEISVNHEPAYEIVMPSENTSDGRKFIGRMKEAVREEAYRQEKEFKPEFSQLFPPFKGQQGGDDEYFYG